MRRGIKGIVFFLLLCIAVSMVAGCSGKSGDEKKGEDKGAVTEGTQNSGGAGKNNGDKGATPGEAGDNAKNGSTFKATLYFHDSEAMNAVKEERDISFEGNAPDIAQKAGLCIEELAKGSTKGLFSSVPAATKVRSAALDKDVLTVDLSQEFEKDHVGGSAGVLMSMSQLVLTLTELEGVKQVKFKIEGRTLEDFKGHIEFNKPFLRSEYEQYIK